MPEIRAASNGHLEQVEYRDPSDVFSLVSNDLISHLPLRNLNWQPQNRPVRQIRSLYLDFVPDNFTRNAHIPPPVPPKDSERTNSSIDIVGNGVDASGRNAVTERRHQIPGLQTSSYLKLYLLRCDDKITYKATERAKLREWMQQIGASKKNGNHDAFEWLILHVVFPDTQAASEPRWRETTTTTTATTATATEESEEQQQQQQQQQQLKERPKQGAKWPGKSKRTVFDKLRADFNESGKSALDRVAQIKLPKDQFPPELLPVPAVAGTIKETPEERQKAWDDLIGKIRSLTLRSFDQRVKQYEADIAEQDSRRAMPGFNFCTFFIYKEGLAKALESVGLIEDALVIYDELSLGLEIVLRERASGKAEVTATTFAPYTEGIKEKILGLDKAQPNGTDGNEVKSHKSHKDAETAENDYRERIARSSISVFDFFGYLFARQKVLILRVANAQATRAKLSLSDGDASEDLILISEVCWRGAAFIHNNARILRKDLLAYRDEKHDWTLTDADVESLASCWAYEMAGRVLEETASYALEQAAEPGRRESLPNGHASIPRSDSLNLSTSSSVPARTTSLPPRNSRVSELQNRSPLHSASENDLMSRPSSSGTDNERKSISVEPGFAELVTYRASLVMLRRKSLESLAKQRGWIAGWAMVRELSSDTVEDVDLNGDVESSSETDDAQTKENRPASDAVSPELILALSSKQEFYQAYDRLSEQAMRYYVTATQTKTAEAIIGDLAILKYQQGDYEYAVSYFQHVLPLYADDGWSLMESETLRVYAACLKEMDKREDYVKTMLSIMANACAKKKSKTIRPLQFEVADDEPPALEGLLAKLISYSTSLDEEITTDADPYYSDVECDREIQHFDDRDGFVLRLHLRHLLDEKVEYDQIAIRLVSVEQPTQEIWVSRDQVRLKQGLHMLELESNITAFGPYLIDKVVLRAKLLRFEYDFQSKAEPEPAPVENTEPARPPRQSQPYKQPWIYLYPTQHAFNVNVKVARDFQLGASRFLDIKLSSGGNDVSKIDLKLRPASAGLRLQVTDFRATDIDHRNDREPSSGRILLGSLGTDSSALVQVPYTFEQAGPDIVVRVEASYHTPNGSFMYLVSAKLPTNLPVHVDVRDNFHFDMLFSSYTCHTMNHSPLCITHAAMESSEMYEVAGPPVLPMPMVAMERQPVHLLYKITRKTPGSGKTSKRQNALTFSLQYYLVEEVFMEALLGTFADALDQSHFGKLSGLLVPFLSLQSESSLSTRDMGMAVLVNEATTPPFEEVGWQEVIQTLSSTIRQQLSDWLKEWHSRNKTIALDQNTAQAKYLRHITLPVDVPQVDFVHKTTLLLPRETKFSKHFPPIAIWGEPIQAQLKVRSTTGWGNKTNTQLGNQLTSKDESTSTKFILDVQADESWLIGGQRRAHFAFREGSELTFDLLLIPLKRGNLVLPHVQVELDRLSGNIDGSSSENGASALTCETHYESGGQVVRVIRDVKAIKVHIAEPSSSSGHTRSQSRPYTVEPG